MSSEFINFQFTISIIIFRFSFITRPPFDPTSLQIIWIWEDKKQEDSLKKAVTFTPMLVFIYNLNFTTKAILFQQLNFNSK